MKTIIVGAGKVGTKLIEGLLLEKHDIVVIDVDPKAVENAVNKYDVMGLIGIGCEKETLIDAGVERADFFISCASRDEMNILNCVLAKKYGAKHTIARVRDPKYVGGMGSIKDDLGIDMFINPEYRTALEIAQTLKFPSATHTQTFSKGKAVMAQFHISEDNPIVGKSILSAVHDFDSKVLFAVVERDGKAFVPRGEFIIEAGDDVHILGSESELASFTKKTNIFMPSAKSVFIVGGGMISVYLAKNLINNGISVKILEKDPERCKVLDAEIPQATVLLGDGTDQDVLNEERLGIYDSCVTLTGMDEENVIISLYAKQQGVDKVITKINSSSIENMITELGLSSVISPSDIIVDYIIRFVRSRKSEVPHTVKKFYKLTEEVEALEFNVPGDADYIGVPLKELSVKDGTIIGGIIRNGVYEKAGGDSTFLPDDRVLLITVINGITDLKGAFK